MDNQPMTVKRLREWLNHLVELNPKCEDWTIFVLTNDGAVGPSSAAPITYAHQGFDWDCGRVLLHPEKDLVTLKKEQ
jgi:hypothetical protein